MYHPLSLRKNFVWAFVGNAVSAFCMWLLLVVLTKLASVETVGIFAIAQAVGLPISMLLSLKLQVAQVTDARDEFDFGHYYALRIITSIMTVVIIAVVGFSIYEFTTALIITALGFGYSIIAFRETFLAVLQKYERMDLMAGSRIFQGLFSSLLFGLFFWFTRNLVFAIAGLIIARIVVLIFYDMPASRKLLQKNGYSKLIVPHWHFREIWTLIKTTAPLGLVAWLGSLFTSVPRLVMDKFIGRAEVGYFAAMSSLLAVGYMLMMALGQSAMPRLAKYYVENRQGYKLLLTKLTTVALVIGVTGVVVSILFGKQILTLMFTLEYAKHHGVFIQIMIAGSILLLFSCMSAGLTAARKFAVQLPIYAVTALVCMISAFLLIPTYGISGAAWSLLICYIAGFSQCLFFVILAVRKKQDRLEKS
jgi:O-antigen/teichoic acid export membrane protein